MDLYLLKVDPCGKGRKESHCCDRWFQETEGKYDREGHRLIDCSTRLPVADARAGFD
jgi:hypothetical protein